MALETPPAGRLIWRNGEFIPWEDATVHVNAVGHASVSAAFEGVHSYWSEKRGQLNIFRALEHMQRMLDTLRLGWLVPDFNADELVTAAVGLLDSWKVTGRDVCVRPWGFAAGLHREQMVAAGTPAEIVIDSWEADSKLGKGRTCSLAVSSWTRTNSSASPATMKVFSNYHNGRLGTIDARSRGADWPVFLNERGHVTESSGACLAMVKDGVFTTPDLASGILDSITRKTVLQLATEELDIPVDVRPIDRAELYLADEVIVLGTSAEILPAVEVDGFPIGDGKQAGAVAKRLDACYHDVVRGVSDAHDDWLTPVPRPGG